MSAQVVDATARGRRRVRRTTVAGLLLGALAALLIAGVFIGSRSAPVAEVLEALGGAGPLQALVWELRVPRTILAVIVGLALGAAGALMQALTRNPLADPGLLGVNAGAAVAVALALALSLASTVVDTVWWAMGGALLASLVVQALSRRGFDGGSPATTVLAGTAVSAALIAVTNGLVLAAPAAFDSFRFWAVGSLEGRGAEVAWGVAPFVAAGLVLAILLGRGLDAISLGDNTAQALGVNVRVVRTAGVLAVMALCGAATAAIGPVAFVGLTVPHIVRRWVPASQGSLTVFSAIGGGVLVLAADLVGRVLVRPGELEVGIVVALIGGPVFVHLVRRRRGHTAGARR